MCRPRWLLVFRNTIFSNVSCSICFIKQLLLVVKICLTPIDCSFAAAGTFFGQARLAARDGRLNVESEQRQNSSLTPNCSCRIGFAEVMTPNVEEPTVAPFPPGEFRLTMLKMLYASARIWKPKPSRKRLKLMSREMERSTSLNVGPRIILRLELPSTATPLTRVAGF